MKSLFNRVEHIEALRSLKLIDKDPSASQIFVRCPFHEDKTPSLSVNLDKGIFQCFSCKESGTVASLYRKVTNSTLSSLLKKEFKEQPVYLGFKKKKEEVFIDPSFLQSLIPLENSLEAQSFFVRRGLSNLVSSGFEAYYAKELFINGQDLSNRAIIPLYRGSKLINVEARAIDMLNKKKCIYVKGYSIKSLLYNQENLNRDQPLYLFEGLLDCLILYNSEITNATCTFGSNVSLGQIETLKEFKEVVIVPDNDRAGEEMTKKLRDSLGVKLKVLKVPSNKDLGEFLKSKHITLKDLISSGWLKEAV